MQHSWAWVNIDVTHRYSIKPTLKKVSKYENKFAKLQKKAAEFNFRNQLKQVKKKEFTLDDEDKDVSCEGLVLQVGQYNAIRQKKISGHDLRKVTPALDGWYTV